MPSDTKRLLLGVVVLALLITALGAVSDGRRARTPSNTVVAAEYDAEHERFLRSQERIASGLENINRNLDRIATTLDRRGR